MFRYNISSGYWAWLGGNSSNPSPATLRPTPRNAYAFACDAPRRRMFLFGGPYGRPEADLWQYNMSSNVWNLINNNPTSTTNTESGAGVFDYANVPSYRADSALFYSASKDVLYLVGGEPRNSYTLNEWWAYDLKLKDVNNGEWAILGGTVPTDLVNFGEIGVSNSTNRPPCLSAMGYIWDEALQEAWMIGGQCYLPSYPRFFNAVWKLNTDTGLWSWIGGNGTTDPWGQYGTKNVPGGRMGRRAWMGAVFDASSRNLYSFSGYEPSEHYDDVWRLTLPLPAPVAPPILPPSGPPALPPQVAPMSPPQTLNIPPITPPAAAVPTKAPISVPATVPLSGANFAPVSAPVVAAPTQSDNAGTGGNSGAVGGAVGGSIGGLAAIGAIVFLVFIWRRRRGGKVSGEWRKGEIARNG
jgi:hypothetical protein